MKLLSGLYGYAARTLKWAPALEIKPSKSLRTRQREVCLHRATAEALESRTLFSVQAVTAVSVSYGTPFAVSVPVTFHWTDHEHVGVNTFIEIKEAGTSNNWFSLADLSESTTYVSKSSTSTTTTVTVAGFQMDAHYDARIRTITAKGSAYSDSVDVDTPDFVTDPSASDFSYDDQSAPGSGNVDGGFVNWTNADGVEFPPDREYWGQLSNSDFLPDRWQMIDGPFDIIHSGNYAWVSGDGNILEIPTTGDYSDQAHGTIFSGAADFSLTTPSFTPARAANGTITLNTVSNGTDPVMLYDIGGQSYYPAPSPFAGNAGITMNVSNNGPTIRDHWARYDYYAVGSEDSAGDHWSPTTAVIDLSRALQPRVLQTNIELAKSDPDANGKTKQIAQAHIYWDNTAYNETGFKVERAVMNAAKTGPSTTWTLVGTVTGPDVTDIIDKGPDGQGLKSAETYYYKVTALRTGKANQDSAESRPYMLDLSWTNCVVCDLMAALQDGQGAAPSPSSPQDAGGTQLGGVQVTLASTERGAGVMMADSAIWNNSGATSVSDFRAGNGVSPGQMPKAEIRSNGRIVISAAGFVAVFNSDYSATAGNYYSLQSATIGGQTRLVMTDGAGNRFIFGTFDSSGNGGQFIGYRDASGNAVDIDRSVAHSLVMTQTVGTATWKYTYTSDTNDRLTSLVVQKNSTTLDTLTYAYYGASESFGNDGDLKTITHTITDGTTTRTEVSYMRYYTLGEAGGYIGGLKYLVTGSSYDKLAAAYPSPSSVLDSVLASYADGYYEYNADNQITKIISQGNGCSVCSAGLGTTSFTYTDNGFGPASTQGDIVLQALRSRTDGGFGTYEAARAADVNTWKYKRVETQPGYNFSNPSDAQNVTVTTYSNYLGQTILQETTHVASGITSRDFYRYDGEGRQIVHAYGDAVTGSDETLADLVNYGAASNYLANSNGQLEFTDYTGDGNIENTYITQGDNNGSGAIKHYKMHYSYGTHTANGATIRYLASTKVFDTDVTSDPETATGRVTTYSVSFYSGTNQVQELDTTLPAISVANNGPGGSGSTTKEYFDSYGRTLWTMDATGRISGATYGSTDGTVTSQTIDSNSGPTGWTTNSGGLNLSNSYEYDSLRRVTKATDPAGHVSHMIYDDVHHAVFNFTEHAATSTTMTTTGPITMTRTDIPYSYTVSSTTYYGTYDETITFSGTITVSGGNPVMPGVDSTNGSLFNLTGTGTTGSPQFTIQSLSRRLQNTAGQAVESDAYFNITNAVYLATSASSPYSGSAGTNYYATTYAFDQYGRQDMAKSPTGTISRTVYDSMGRVASTWIGTNDTGATHVDPTGGGATGNNMIKVHESIYDHGSGGSGNLTRSINYLSSTKAIATDYFYDWENRLVASKGGLALTLASGIWTADSEGTGHTHPITYSSYDNLGQVTATYTYDGDGLTISDANTDGIPDQPSSTHLQAKTTVAYDELGHAYMMTQWSVSPGGGTPSAGVSSYQWLDSNGQVIKTLGASGVVTKATYDGAGRVTAIYTTNGGGDAVPGATGNYADAASLSGDTVLQQVEYQYDANGDVIKTTMRQRNPNGSGTGALTSSNSRTTYSGAFYDEANRQVASVDVGTNGGSTYARATSDTLPSNGNRTDTFLLTEYFYEDAGHLREVVDPAGLKSETYYDALGRTVKTIANYQDGTPSAGDDQTTLYTYDGSNHVLSVTADMPSGTNDQTTAYVYGITTGQGSAINSNDILQLVKYPTKTTGAPSSSAIEQNNFTYNALGQVLTKTDQNGTVHSYTYDSLGRMKLDAVTTLASGVDGAIRSIGNTYNELGLVGTITSYNTATPNLSTPQSTEIVNQVQNQYNGLGQLTKQVQSHDNSAITSSTPAIQYGYKTLTTGTDNTSRIESLTYPNGRVINYLYTDAGDTSGISNTISRITAISSSTTRGTSDANVIAGYTYMGAGSIVGRSSPNVSMNLFDSGTSTYTGLDQFGRTSNMEWVNTNTSSDIFHIQYGYDRNSNRSYANDLIYTGQSQAYSYDGLNRLTVAQNGVLTSSKDSTSSGFFQNSNNYGLDALGNQTTAGTDESSSLTQSTYNSQNQIDTRKVKGNVSNTGFTDTFGADSTENWTKNGSGDAFNVNSTNAGYLTVTSISRDTINGTLEGEAQTVLLLAANTGPIQSLSTNFVVPNGTTSGQVGIVFGYKSAADYWIQVLDFSDEYLKVFHVVNGAKGTAVASSNTWTSGTSRSIQFVTDGNSIGRPFYVNFTNGFPSGKIGLYTDVANTKFNDVSYWQEGSHTALTGRWTSYLPDAETVQGSTNFDMIDPTTDKLTVGGYASLISPMPVLLNGLTLSRFQATFSVQCDGGASMNFLFDAQGTGARYTLGLQGDGGSVAVSLNGPNGSTISPSSSIVGITNISSSDTVWVRVEASGTTLIVKRIKSSTAPAETAWASPTDTFTFTGLTFTGGQFGYSAGYGKVNIDDLTIKSDPDNNGSYDTTELVETFTLDSSGYDAGSSPQYDSNGNMTFDGTQVYTYDAWNRQVSVAHGYWDGSVAQAGQKFDTLSYDGLGRLITEAIIGQGSGHDVTFQDYYASYQLLEQRTGTNSGTGPTIKQNVWGLQYVNELVQTAVNSNPATDSTCDTTYIVTQDANLNIQGIVNSSGTLVERYGYLPFGERQVYVSDGSDDPNLYTPASQSNRVIADGTAAGYGIMDAGFQGMQQDESTGLVRTPTRMMSVTLGIWLQKEPLGGKYVDGLNLYESMSANPVNRVDPWGLTGMSPMPGEGNAGSPSEGFSPTEPNPYANEEGWAPSDPDFINLLDKPFRTSPAAGTGGFLGAIGYTGAVSGTGTYAGVGTGIGGGAFGLAVIIPASLIGGGVYYSGAGQHLGTDAAGNWIMDTAAGGPDPEAQAAHDAQNANYNSPAMQAYRQYTREAYKELHNFQKRNGQAFNLALGLYLDEQQKPMLPTFAKAHNAVTYWDIYGGDPMAPPPIAAKKLAVFIRTAMYGARHIYVNLSGMCTEDVAELAKLGSRGIDANPKWPPVYGDAIGSNVTNWEIYTIESNSNLKQKTTYYSNGVEK